MKAIWKEIPRDPKKGKWIGMYATLNPRGEIVINRKTWEKSGSPEAYQIFFDEANQRIGLQPSTPNSRGAYLAGARGSHGGRRIMAYPIIAECRLVLKNTIQFPFAEIDTDGLLILDLRTATVNRTSLAWERRRNDNDRQAKKQIPEPPGIEMVVRETVEQRAEVDTNL